MMFRIALIIVLTLAPLGFITEASAETVLDVNFLRSKYGIGENETPVFILNPATGEVAFGDGATGEDLPSGTDNIVGIYRTEGDEEEVLSTFPIPRDGSPIFIPFSAFPKDDSENPILSLIFPGITHVTVEIIDDAVKLTNVEFTPTPVPEPTTIFLLGSGLVGLAGLRRRFRK